MKLSKYINIICGGAKTFGGGAKCLWGVQTFLGGAHPLENLGGAHPKHFWGVRTPRKNPGGHPLENPCLIITQEMNVMKS
jgi:hypothetical protein